MDPLTLQSQCSPSGLQSAGLRGRRPVARAYAGPPIRMPWIRGTTYVAVLFGVSTLGSREAHHPLRRDVKD